MSFCKVTITPQNKKKYVQAESLSHLKQLLGIGRVEVCTSDGFPLESEIDFLPYANSYTSLTPEFIINTE